MEEMVQQIKWKEDSKGKVPLPQAELQGDYDPKIPRHAFIIGNNGYTHFGQLANCKNDAKGMKSALEQHGFVVEMHLDLGKSDTEAALQGWVENLPSSQCSALVHFSGHGLEIDGENFLVPIDADLSRSSDKEDVKKQCISVKRIQAWFRNKLGGIALLMLFLDCCRENPFKCITFKSYFAKPDLDSTLRMFVGFATAPGKLAAANNFQLSPHSPFTYALINCLGKNDVSALGLDEFMHSVRELVERVSKQKQTPFHDSNLTQTFKFRVAR